MICMWYSDNAIWLGHVIRIKDDWVTKKAQNLKPEGVEIQEDLISDGKMMPRKIWEKWLEDMASEGKRKNGSKLQERPRLNSKDPDANEGEV